MLLYSMNFQIHVDSSYFEWLLVFKNIIKKKPHKCQLNPGDKRPEQSTTYFK